MKYLSFLPLLIGTAVLAEPIEVAYRDKPPYSYTENGQPKGFLLERTIAIFKRAGIEARYLEVPVKRITTDIQANQRPICSPSWYKLPEREAYARFSLPIHQDKPHVVLASPKARAAVSRHKLLSSLFADASLQLGVVEGVSYGQALDTAIAQTAKPPMRSTVTPLQLARMVAHGRADYMLIDQEDLSYLQSHSALNTLKLVKLAFPDMPAGLKRYIMCSQQVDPATLNQLDEAIRAVVPGLTP
ncbi:ABC transporter substrate-binding protein [Chitinimonas sp. BJYL2]|uniref:substrate-binding periplasmic protein n=1 Tax=Chitinimonas sp. BJYL2 TaxID=2976696 RepID=UPI0022B44119|nr:transporter substrate-binding domain-containing protein [Chitinimonas sp. BJYL2]